eukprot:tig00020961_g16754.t1
MGDLLLDSAIRDWVLLPLAAVLVFVDLLRHWITKAASSEKKLELKEIQSSQTLIRAAWLRRGAVSIPPAAFKMRKAYFTNKIDGVLHMPSKPQDPMSMMNPEPMMDMMKKNLFSNILPNILIMGWISYFFSGFLVAKMPFPLTPKFKAMLQRGVDLADLDPTYISALSWYFLSMYGRRGIMELLLGDTSNIMDESKMMTMQMQAMNQPGQDVAKMYAGERENIDLMQHVWLVDQSEKMLLGVIQAEKQARASGPAKDAALKKDE